MAKRKKTITVKPAIKLDDAKAIFREEYGELESRLLDVRPKLECYNARIVEARVRADMQECYYLGQSNTDEFRAIMRESIERHCAKFTYKRGSKYAKKG